MLFRSTEKPLDAHDLPPGMRLELALAEARDVPRGKDTDGKEELVPEVLLSSSGEISEFRLDIRIPPEDDPVAGLESDGSGTLRDL